jgi:pimeloyl-ACP methyl ester carboxylesterase
MVTVRRGELGGQPVVWREAATPPGRTPVVYVHGVPTSSRIWEPLLELTGGFAPDMCGFGESAKRGDHVYDPPFFADWLDRFLADRGLDRVRLVVQDWGVGWGLVWAQRAPERIERLVVIDGVPLLPGYRWHRIARAWRTPVLGELFMGVGTNRFVVRRETRGPDWFVDSVTRGFDQGTQRAILRLYRSADPARLVQWGSRLDTITCPALVLWGERDPYMPPRIAQAYADALGGPAEVRVKTGLRHWPWLDDPQIPREICGWLDGGS